jgi:DNA-binding transcriptional MocR family regulator
MMRDRGRSSRGSPTNARFRTNCGAAACGARRVKRRRAATAPPTIRGCRRRCSEIWRFIAASRQILIVPTAQAGLVMIANALLAPGDHAWIESPGYGGAHVELQAAGAVVTAIPRDEHGITIGSRKHAPRRSSSPRRTSTRPAA